MRKWELKEKLYSALRYKAEINDLSEKLLTKYLDQEKELQQLCSQAGLDYNVKEVRNSKRPYSKVRLYEKADGIYYFKLAP